MRAASKAKNRLMVMAALVVLPGMLVGEGVRLTDILAPVSAVGTGGVEEDSEEESEKGRGGQTVRYRLLKADSILERLAGRLGKQHAGLEEMQLKAADSREWPRLRIPEEANWKVVCETDFSPEPDGRWMPRLSLLVDNELKKSFRVEVKVLVYREVWMTGERLARGSEPVESVLEPVVRNIYEGRYRPIPITEDLGGYELERAVAAGRLLEWDDLRERPLVRRGETVEVLVQQGALQIAMRAKCLEDGTRGEMVTLRNEDTRHEFTGTVVGRSQIQFQP